MYLNTEKNICTSTLVYYKLYTFKVINFFSECMGCLETRYDNGRCLDFLMIFRHYNKSDLITE